MMRKHSVGHDIFHSCFGHPLVMSLCKRDKLVFMAILWHLNRSGETWCGTARISALSGYSRPAICVAIRSLEVHGLLVVSRAHNHSNLYTMPEGVVSDLSSSRGFKLPPRDVEAASEPNDDAIPVAVDDLQPGHFRSFEGWRVFQASKAVCQGDLRTDYKLI